MENDLQIASTERVPGKHQRIAAIVIDKEISGTRLPGGRDSLGDVAAGSVNANC